MCQWKEIVHRGDDDDGEAGFVDKAEIGIVRGSERKREQFTLPKHLGGEHRISHTLYPSLPFLFELLTHQYEGQAVEQQAQRMHSYMPSNLARSSRDCKNSA